jgi:Domain of unknown function (DUF4276)
MNKAPLQNSPPVAFFVEGASDAPVVTALMRLRFQKKYGKDFEIHAHRGKGSLPLNPLARPDPKQLRLLGLLPAKLRGMPTTTKTVVVLMDLDKEDKTTYALALKQMLQTLKNHTHQPLPQVVFCFAIEEIESWFIADFHAVEKHYDTVNVKALRTIPPDAICNAAEALGAALGYKTTITGAIKYEWAKNISPHLNFTNPKSPSLRRVIRQLVVAKV